MVGNKELQLSLDRCHGLMTRYQTAHDEYHEKEKEIVDDFVALTDAIRGSVAEIILPDMLAQLIAVLMSTEGVTESIEKSGLSAEQWITNVIRTAITPMSQVSIRPEIYEKIAGLARSRSIPLSQITMGETISDKLTTMLNNEQI